MASDKLEQTYYELLDISRDASLDEVQAAYREAKATYSPDSAALYSMFSQDEAQQINQLIDEAYQVLSNHVRRKEYDQSLKNGGFEVFVDKQEERPIEAEKPILKFGKVDENERSNLKKDGIGITRFSKYDIDEIFEQEIAEQQVFDGSFLKKIREYKNVEIKDLSLLLKIGKHHLIAIEENDFKTLPALIFVRNYTKQYAELLDLDPTKVSESYIKILKEVREER